MALNPDSGHINADPGQIEQVVINLVVNARDAMPKGGKLTINTASIILDGNQIKNFPDLREVVQVMLTIADTGTGMTDEVKAHLFEPFFTTKPPDKGTGLGLATCFGIVKQNSAHIQMHGELRRGTTFKIYFPQVQTPLLHPLPGCDPAPCALEVDNDIRLSAVTAQ